MCRGITLGWQLMQPSGKLCFLSGLLLMQKVPFQKENYKLLSSIVTHCILVCVCGCVCMGVCVCVCACTCTHACTHIFVHFWIYKQTHTHTKLDDASYF